VSFPSILPIFPFCKLLQGLTILRKSSQRSCLFFFFFFFRIPPQECSGQLTESGMLEDSLWISVFFFFFLSFFFSVCLPPSTGIESSRGVLVEVPVVFLFFLSLFPLIGGPRKRSERDAIYFPRTILARVLLFFFLFPLLFCFFFFPPSSLRDTGSRCAQSDTGLQLLRHRAKKKTAPSLALPPRRTPPFFSLFFFFFLLFPQPRWS